MKNWLPLVFGPAFAIASMPSRVACRSVQLVVERVAGAAAAGAARVAALQHADVGGGGQPVARGVVEVLLAGQELKLFTVHGAFARSSAKTMSPGGGDIEGHRCRSSRPCRSAAGPRSSSPFPALGVRAGAGRRGRCAVESGSAPRRGRCAVAVAHLRDHQHHGGDDDDHAEAGGHDEVAPLAGRGRLRRRWTDAPGAGERFSRRCLVVGMLIIDSLVLDRGNSTSLRDWNSSRAGRDPEASQGSLSVGKYPGRTRRIVDWSNRRDGRGSSACDNNG